MEGQTLVAQPSSRNAALVRDAHCDVTTMMSTELLPEPQSPGVTQAVGNS